MCSAVKSIVQRAHVSKDIIKDTLYLMNESIPRIYTTHVYSYQLRLHFSPFQINTQLFTKWLPAAILDDQKSLSIAFLAISNQYATFIVLILFTKWLPAAILDDRKLLLIAFLAISDHMQLLFFSHNGCRRPFWMTENHL